MTTKAEALLARVNSIASYDLSAMSNLSPTRTGLAGVVLYCGRADDGGQHSPYRIKVAVGNAWGASCKVFSMGTQGKINGRWFYVRGSDYKTESDVPAEILIGVRQFIELNHDLLKEWVDYEGLEDDLERFVPRVKRIAS